MIYHGVFDKKHLTISFKPQCLTLSIEHGQTTDVLSFDHSGRLWTALLDDISYRRGLDGKTVAKWADAQGWRNRRWLAPSEAEDLAQKCQALALDVANRVKDRQITMDAPLPQTAVEALWKAANHTAFHRADDIQKYHSVYMPVGILPPDQYGAVVLQATEGCSFNRCTFCSFYRARPFRIKDPQQFEEHCREVKEFLGAGLSLRRTIFLGDANALVISFERLRQVFQITRRHFDVDALGGVYAFLDGVSGKTKTAKEYRQLVELGLKRVYIGLESGSEPLLKYLNKPSMPSSIIRTVQTLKEGGAAVGIIVLLGAGGRKFAADHVRGSINLLNQLHLDAEDILYFSELIESEGMDYQQKAYAENLQPLSAEERVRQGETIEQGLRFSARGGIPHIARYDIREFVY